MDDWRRALWVFDGLKADSEHHDGVTLRPDKCRMLWPRSANPPLRLVDECRKRGIILLTRSAEYLGGLMTFDPQLRSDFFSTAVKAAISELQPLRDEELPAQITHRLLQFAATPKLTYLMRVTPPTPEIRRHLQRFDDEVAIFCATNCRSIRYNGARASIRRGSPRGGVESGLSRRRTVTTRRTLRLGCPQSATCRSGTTGTTRQATCRRCTPPALTA